MLGPGKALLRSKRSTNRGNSSVKVSTFDRAHSTRLLRGGHEGGGTAVGGTDTTGFAPVHRLTSFRPVPRAD